MEAKSREVRFSTGPVELPVREAIASEEARVLAVGRGPLEDAVRLGRLDVDRPGAAAAHRDRELVGVERARRDRDAHGAAARAKRAGVTTSGRWSRRAW